MRAAVGIAALLCLVAAAGATHADRLTEKTISLLPDNALTDEDYTPRHLAGYFKAWVPPKLEAEQKWCCNLAAMQCADYMLDCLQLNRTYAGEMFYLFFEHRTSDDAPLVLWMTGEPLALPMLLRVHQWSCTSWLCLPVCRWPWLLLRAGCLL